MSASDSWDWARSRLGTALARASGRDDDSGGVWDDDEAADETDFAAGDVGERRLTLVSPSRVELSVMSVTTFDDAQAIADAFRCDKPVVVDLQHCENEVARRVVDFCSGLTYARDGGLRAIAEKVFLLAPPHVELSGDDRRGLSGSDFFNQT
jgi:cell division inhibitor SepF